MNHVWLYIWPVIDAPVEELTALKRAVAPLTVGRRASRRSSRRAGSPRPGGRRRRGVGAVLLPAGLGRHRARRRAADRAGCARSTTTRRRCCGRAGAARSTRTSWSDCSPAAGRRSSSSTTSTTPGALVPVDRPPGGNKAGLVVGRRPDAHRALPGGHAARRAARRPDQGAGRAGRARVPRDRRRPRPGRASSACRSSGSRSRPAPGSRWTAAPRTWTGWPGRCAASSSSPRPAARSTSSSPASTSAPSRTGTPRRRCSCTPRASS